MSTAATQRGGGMIRKSRRGPRVRAGGGGRRGPPCARRGGRLGRAAFPPLSEFLERNVRALTSFSSAATEGLGVRTLQVLSAPGHPRGTIVGDGRGSVWILLRVPRLKLAHQMRVGIWRAKINFEAVDLYKGSRRTKFLRNGSESKCLSVQ